MSETKDNPMPDKIIKVRAVKNANIRHRTYFGNSLRRTKQSFKDECDVNNIMRKFEKTGLIDHVNNHQGEYGQFIGFDDYHTSLNQIQDAEASFMTIPAKIRAKFDNSAGKFLAFAQNPDNLPKMVEMGLAKARPKTPETPENPTPTSKAAKQASDEPAQNPANP